MTTITRTNQLRYNSLANLPRRQGKSAEQVGTDTTHTASVGTDQLVCSCNFGGERGQELNDCVHQSIKLTNDESGRTLKDVVTC